MNLDPVDRVKHVPKNRRIIKKVNVFLNGVSEVLRHFVFVIDRFGVALGFAGRALDAVLRVDVVGRPFGVVFNLVDCVAWADLHARAATLTFAGDHICHFCLHSTRIMF